MADATQAGRLEAILKWLSGGVITLAAGLLAFRLWG
jgi:hypothetical protein